MTTSLVGKRVQVIIDEDGTNDPPRLSPGTIVRGLGDPDRTDYFLVNLDTPVECIQARTGANWVLRDLVVAPRLKGDSLYDLFAPGGLDFVIVTIDNAILPLDADAGEFDVSQVEYFALGRVVRVA